MDISTSSNHSKLTIALGVTAGALFIILIVTVGCFSYSMTRRKSQIQGRTNYLKRSDREFIFTEVLTMTNNFGVVIGKGGFGTVYLGQLGGDQVAVKLLSPSSAQGYREFRAEAELLMRVHHKNLISLIGYCEEEDNLGLIYEHMAEGNLTMHLSEGTEDTLSWEQRLQIAVDAAQGLDYLHRGCKPPIVHRDVKSSNILINEHFQAKVSDFGLSRTFAAEGVHLTTTIAGTPGYLDPEYFRTNMLNEKSDVYSFGIILMEIITCRPVLDGNPIKTHIIDFIEDNISRGDMSRIVDHRLEGKFDETSAWKVVELARACVFRESSGRPTMGTVVIELEQCLAMTRSPDSELVSAMKTSSLNVMSASGPRAR